MLTHGDDKIEFTPRKCGGKDTFIYLGCTKGQVIVLDLEDPDQIEIIDGEL
jgi:hypothetical protein